MRAISAQAGFTLIEALVAITVLSILLAIGVPSMQNWVLANKAASATELYAEGIKLARELALSHNAHSRLLLVPLQNANNQFDWQVDLCFPDPAVSGSQCNDTAGQWSTPTVPAPNDPGATTYLSVYRTAAGLPSDHILQPTVTPGGSRAAYFTPQGWVDASVGVPNLSRIQFDPVAPSQLRATAVVISLAGGAIKCDPSLQSDSGDSRACP